MMAMPMPNLNLSMPTPPATKGKRPLRHLTATDKIEAIQRIHDGESKASVARDIGVPESTLRGWCKNEEKLRYMSRQSQENAEKLNSDAMASAMGVDFMNGPPEKRMKFDSSFFANGKLKYDELQRRAAAGMGLDLSDKREGGMGLPGLQMGDFSPLSGLSSKTGKDIGLKGFGGADMGGKGGDTKGDLSMAAISPLTSLSHLSGMSSLGQSPLALSFNDIANNLNLLAQLNNPSLAMSGLGNAGGSNNKSTGNRAMKPNPHSPGRPEGGDKSPSLTVKNLAKLQQKSSTDLSSMTNFMDKYKKSQQQAQQASQGGDDALWYWLKSQQTMLGLNNLYSQLPRASSPQGSPSPHFQNNPSTPITRIPTPPIINTPRQTPPTSSTPEVDSKQTSWFWQWYKNFGASFTPTDTKPGTPTNNAAQKAYENILYSQLTKNDNINNNYESHSSTPKPEDLSQHQDIKLEGGEENHEESEPNSPGNSDANSDKVKVKEELDNVLYNNNNNNDCEKSERDSDQDESVKSSSEALEHGEKFLRWLETCSDPSVTAMQVMQFRLLINCLKNSAERMSASSVTANNGSAEEKPLKIRRRK